MLIGRSTFAGFTERGLLMRYLLVLVLAAWLWGAAVPGPGLAGESEVTTTGVGEAAAQPDHANVVVTIRVTEKTATESTRKAAATYQQLIQQVKPFGVTPSDVMTQRFSVAQDWKRDDKGRPKEFIGYLTGHELRILVRNRERVGEVIDAAIEAGVRRIDRIEFASTKADSAQRVALAAAVRDARERAEIMAEATGGRLGELIEVITEEAVRARGGDLRVDADRARVVSLTAEFPPTSLVPAVLRQRAVVVGRWQLLSDQ